MRDHLSLSDAAEATSADDLSALAWLQPELRRTLEAAHKSLRRYLREAESIGSSDLDSADPAPLAAARHQLHQAVGAMSMLDQPALAQVLRASETALQRIVARPALLNAQALETIERNSFALLDYLARQLAGKPVSPVMLFPQYRATQQLAGADRVHPADLWPVSWAWHALPADRSAQPRAADEGARAEMESAVLALMRQPDSGVLARMSDFCADLAAGASRSGAADGRLATFWQLASALFEAQAGGLLKSDVHVKRIASRLLAQLRMNVRGQHELSDRLAQDLLFFCHQAAAPNAEHPAPRLAAVRSTWPQPPGLAASDYDTPSLGRFDPAVLALARKRVAAAKDVWSGVAGGELHRLANLGESFALVDDSVRRIFPAGDSLGQALVAAADRTVAAESEPAPTLAMEAATALLYLDACLEDGDFDHPELPARVRRLAQRIDDVAEGGDPHPLEAWMEELYRRVSDRQTMGSVVQELRASLSEVEKHIDQFFRQPDDRQVLVPVPQQLSAMRGVLSVLGMSQASQAVLHMRDDIDALVKNEAGLPQGEIERLADNLGALSFLIDMLSVQPQLAKQLFQFDAGSGRLSAVMGQPHRPAPAVADVPADLPLVDQVQALARDLQAGPEQAPSDEELAQRLDRLAQQALAGDEAELARTLGGARVALRSAGDAATRRALRQDLAQGLLGLGQVPQPAPLPPAPVPPPHAPAAPGSTGLEDDLEMREIFIEEAREVVADAGDALRRLADQPESAADMTQLRRAFHTLKGSGRMVGLTDFGAASWACEQLFNARLAMQPVRMDAPLQAFTEQALASLAAWTDAIASGDASAHSPAALVAAADALRLGEVAAQEALADAGAEPEAGVPDADTPADTTADTTTDTTTGGSAVAAAAIDPAPPAGLSGLPTLPDFPPLFDLPELSEPVELSDPSLPDAAPQPEAAELAAADFALHFDPQPQAPADDAPPAPDTAAAPGPLGDDADAVLVDDDPAGRGATARPPGFPELPVDAPVLPFELHFDAPAQAAAAAPEEASALATASQPAAPTVDTEGPDDADADADARPPAPGAVPELALRVPGLPSAADLDLGLPAARDERVAFQFDLGGLGSPEAASADAAPAALLMTGELPDHDAPASERMPLAGTVELPPEGQPRAALPGVDELVLDLAEIEVPAGVDDAPLDTSAPLIASDLPLTLDGEAGPGAEPEPSATPAAETDDSLAGLDTLMVMAAPVAPALPIRLDVAPDPDPDQEPAAPPEDPVKVIGPLRISIPLFNIFLNEADELSRRLGMELAEWVLESDTQAVPDSSIALAHSLAGNSATVGYTDLSALARALEHALMRSQAVGQGRDGEGELFIDAADEIRRLLHQFAAGFLRPVSPALMERLADHERWPLPQPLPVAEAADSMAGDLANVADATDATDATDAADATDTVDTAAAEPALAPVAAAAPAVLSEDDFDAEDQIDPDLFPIFEEEADELLPQLQARLRDWLEHPADRDSPSSCMRTLHTFKGGARLAGAMRLGEMAHRLESAVEKLVASDAVRPQDVEPLLALADHMSVAFARLRDPAAADLPETAAVLPAPALAAPAGAPLPQDAPPADAAFARLAAPDGGTTAEARPEDKAENKGEGAAAEPAAASAAPSFTAAAPALVAPAAEAGDLPQPADAQADAQAAAGHEAPAQADAPAAGLAAALASSALVGLAANPAAPPGIDWARFQRPVAAAVAPPPPAAERSPAGSGAVRVRAGLLDRLVNQAGEVSITRARIDADVRSLQGSLHELTESLDRMRRQLRDIELQAETQISSRLEQAKAASQAFDPLEMDRFTRFQELTRFMAESVNDVATLQRSLQRTLQSTEDELAAQARLTRELQDDLLRTRMVEFESMADRLYRTVRQAAKETGKQVRLDIVGGAIEVDRGVLERMTGPFEHLLRNCVAHGVEMAEQRRSTGKAAEGQISIQVTQSGNEVAIDFGDDGAGLDLPRIRQRAIERGLLAADVDASDDELSQLIFSPGFSTATTVTELAGRGIGMDVVRAEVNAMGGRIEIRSQPGQGTHFRLLLPLTTAVTQVVMLRCGVTSVAVPSTLVEVVRRVAPAEIDNAYEQGHFEFGDESVAFFWLPALLQAAQRGETRSRSQNVVIIRSAAQRVALHVDEVVGNQEVVVKNVGPQLARLPGLAGVTLLPSGVVSLIYNPVALAAVYADAARRLMRQQPPQPGAAAGADGDDSPAPQRAPMVMVVDDSLTVRRVTQRLLVREGYRVVLAKDGLEALEKLAEERPAVLLSDIEMPRMDGFDLLRNVRADAKLAGLPVVMITSRIAQKHRDYAMELGVDHYLGKPYSEELLLSLVARYTGAEQAARAAAPA